MNKIALISGWYTYNGKSGIHPNHKFVFECMYQSAKKYFLKNFDVDFIFITNDELVEMDNVINLKINHDVTGFWHMCLMKILSLKYIEDKYDMVFVIDYDSIFVNEINNELLENEFYILHHFFYPTIESIHNEITKTVPLNFDRKKDYWTMGNFFGGKMQIIKDLVKFTEEQHQLYVSDSYHPDYNFYSRYPEELFLIKYIFEKNINHTRLQTDPYPQTTNKNLFLSDFQEDETIYPVFKETKILHNTKKNIETLKNIINYYI